MLHLLLAVSNPDLVSVVLIIKFIWMRPDNAGLSQAWLPLLARAGSDLIYIQLHCDLVSIWAGLTAQQNASVDWQLVQRSSLRDSRVPRRVKTRDDRKCEGPAAALPSREAICVVFIKQTVCVQHAHTQSHIMPQIPAELCSTHTSWAHTSSSPDVVQQFNTVLQYGLRRVINYSLRLSALRHW